MNQGRQRLLDSSSAELLHDLVQSVVSALETRDPHTADHSLRVGDMTERVCAFMGIPEPESFEIHMAAHVHDIGKIGLRDSILHKDARLTEEEHRVLRQHPEVGFRILSASDRLSSIARIVLCHHERWDGSGYPQGLSGREIPLGARIVAVCDSIDAMLGKLPARKRLTAEACRKEIAAGSGTLYDPEVVSAVMSHWDEILDGIVDRIRSDSEAGSDCSLDVPLRCIVPMPEVRGAMDSYVAEHAKESA